MSAHKFVHVELSARDREEAKKFYGGVFDWVFQDFPEQHYTTFATEEGALGGGFNPVSEQSPAGLILVYIHTDDLAESVAKIEDHGGKVLLESFEIPGVGTMATFQDPTGNTLALLQPAEGQ